MGECIIAKTVKKKSAAKKKPTKSESQQTSALYRILADTANDMIFIVNCKGIVEYLNEASAIQYHDTPENLIGKPLADFFPSYIYKRQSASLERVFKSGESLYIANDTQFPNGQKLLDTWLTPIKDKSGKVTAIFGVSRDVTKYRLAEVALKHKTTEAMEAKARAQIFFDFLAHDIANLISPILTYSETLLETDIPDRAMKDHLGKISVQARRTATFIMNLRMLVEAEKIAPAKSERFDLKQFFMDLEKMARAQYPEKCHISLDFPKNKPVEVLGGVHIRNAFMLGFASAMSAPAEKCMDINVKIQLIKRHSRPFWQVRMEIPGRMIPSHWQDMVITPFDPTRREKGLSAESVSFAAAILRHFGGDMRDENIDDKVPSKGHAIVIELPKAGSWHTSKNT